MVKHFSRLPASETLYKPDDSRRLEAAGGSPTKGLTSLATASKSEAKKAAAGSPAKRSANLAPVDKLKDESQKQKQNGFLLSQE